MGCWQLTAARTEEEDKFSGLQCKPPFPYKIVDATILFIKTEAQCLRIGEDEDIFVCDQILNRKVFSKFRLGRTPPPGKKPTPFAVEAEFHQPTIHILQVSHRLNSMHPLIACLAASAIHPACAHKLKPHLTHCNADAPLLTLSRHCSLEISLT